MTTITTYRCEVDLYRNGSVFRGHQERLYDRNTKGVYLVGAKNPKEAKQLLQKAIGFGAITIPKRTQWKPDNAPVLKHKEIVKINRKKIQKTDYIEWEYTYDANIAHATAPTAK